MQHPKTDCRTKSEKKQQQLGIVLRELTPPDGIKQIIQRKASPTQNLVVRVFLCIRFKKKPVRHLTTTVNGNENKLLKGAVINKLGQIGPVLHYIKRPHMKGRMAERNQTYDTSYLQNDATLVCVKGMWLKPDRVEEHERGATIVYKTLVLYMYGVQGLALTDYEGSFLEIYIISIEQNRIAKVTTVLVADV